KQLRLVLEMMVERRRPHAEFERDETEAQFLEPDFVDDFQRGFRCIGARYQRFGRSCQMSISPCPSLLAAPNGEGQRKNRPGPRSMFNLLTLDKRKAIVESEESHVMTNRLQRKTFVSPDGVRLVGDHGGPIDAPCAVLLHGGGQTRHSWSRAVERLLDAGL